MLRRVACLFNNLFRRRRVEHDLDEELRSSFEIIVDRYLARGLSLPEAQRAARLEFEGVEQVKDRVRDHLFGSSLQTIPQDLRYALRGLRRTPSYTAIALITLALGIGVNTAIFSVFYAVLLRPLPYGNPERLVLVWASLREAGAARAVISGPMLGEIQRRNQSLAGVAGIWVTSATFPGENPEQVKLALVTNDFFDVLGVRASHGRTFTKDERAGGRPAMILTGGFFQRRFASNAATIGQGLQVSTSGNLKQTQSATLVGVLPAGFQLHFAPDANIPTDVEAFTPFSFNLDRAPRTLYYIRTVARLKPGITIAQAQHDLDRVAAELRGAYTEFSAANLRFSLAGMQDDAFHDIRPGLVALFAGAAFVLLICCVNVTSLLLARAADRRKEIALRLALGASRNRILRQLIAEGGVLCVLGGAAGVAAGWAGFRALLAIRPERFARIGEAGLSWPVLASAILVSLVATILFGLVPAFESFRLDLTETLRAGGRGWLGRLHRRAGAALVVSEITLGFMLVTGAALTARTLSRIEQVHPGFEPRHLLTFQVAFGQTLSPALPLSAIHDWETQFAALPGVERVGGTSHLPLDDLPNWYGPYRPEGVTEDQAAALVADLRSVTSGYLPAMGARLLEGRMFDQQDRAASRTVVIVDELVARSTWPGRSAIGQKIVAEHVVNGGMAPLPGIVVGVIEHVRSHSLTTQVRGQIYIPFEQSPRSPLTFVLRTAVDPVSLVPAIRRMLHDRALAMTRVRPMTEYITRDIAPPRFSAVLASVFGALALLLAATGIYGVFNYQISRRIPEMGIRMALGAHARDVLRLVLGHGLLLAAIGVILGSAGAFLTSRWLGSLIYGVSPRDPLSYTLALLLLPAAALLGCWRPARRAASSNPADMFREE